jgi:phosphomannomutase
VIEAGIDGVREIECAVMVDDSGIARASRCAEIIVRSGHEFYDFAAKYLEDAADLVVPAEIPEEVEARMRELDSPLGGEMSGHIFFKERWFGFDDGSYAGARLLEILSRSADVSAVLHALPSSHSTPELNVACAEGEPPRLVAELVALGQQQFSAPAQVSTIDGLRIDWPDGFGLIRASNTTPVLVLRFEGHTEAALHRIEADMLALLQRVKPGAQLQGAAH